MRDRWHGSGSKPRGGQALRLRALATVGLAEGLRLSMEEMSEWSSREYVEGGGGYLPRRICVARGRARGRMRARCPQREGCIGGEN